MNPSVPAPATSAKQGRVDLSDCYCKLATVYRWEKQIRYSRKVRCNHRERSPCWREGQSPEILRSLVLLDELNSVTRDSVRDGQLRYDARGNLSAAPVPYQDDRAHNQIATQLNDSTMPVQADSCSSHRKRALQAIFARQAYRCLQEHPITATLADRTATRACRDGCVLTMELRVAVGEVPVHADVRKIAGGNGRCKVLR